MRRLAQSGTLALWAGLVGAYLARVDGRPQDDLYITYRYARNLAEGHGFVYNAGERIFGLSEPGLGLLLGGLHRLSGISLPHLGSLVFGVSLFALAAVMLAAGSRRGRGPEAVLGGTLLVGWSLVWVSHGSGAPLMLALLAGAALLSEAGGRDRSAVAAGVLAGLAVWVRPDAAAGLALLVLLVLLTGRHGRRRAVVLGLSGLLVAGAGAVAAGLYFGSVLPQTLEAKRAMVEGFRPGHGPGDFWRSALALVRAHAGPGRWPLLVLGAVGAVASLREPDRAGRLVALFAGVVAATYSLLGIPFFSWYVLPVVVAGVYGFAHAVGAAARWVSKWLRPGRVLPATAAAVVAVALAAPGVLSVARGSLDWSRRFNGFGRLVTYAEAGEWIRTHTPEGASVAYIEIGVIGYHSRRPLVDLLGLVSPASLPYVARHDLPAAYLAQPTDLVVVRHPGRMEALVRRPWFPGAFRSVARFPLPAGRGSVEVFARRAGAPLPEPPPPDS